MLYNPRENAALWRSHLTRIAVLILLTFLPDARAGVIASLPLEGHYRPGRYMPVRLIVHGEKPGAALTLAADGGLATELALAGGAADAIVPFLAISDPRRHLRYSVTGAAPVQLDLSLRALTDDERLVGMTADDPAIASLLFPDKTVISVRLDVTRPLLSPVAAWEALDGLVLDAASAARVNEAQLSSILSGGAIVAVQSAVRPAGQWPWQRFGAYWIVHHDPVGPRVVAGLAAFEPTIGLAKGWPADFRRHVVVAAAVFCVLALAIALWRSRYAWLAVAGLCVIAAGGAIAWRSQQSPLFQRSGSIFVRAGRLTQHDAWTYQAVVREADASVAFRDLVHPIFERTVNPGVLLRCLPDGQPDRFFCRLKPGKSLAYVSRSIFPGKLGTSFTNPVTSPLREVAEELYVFPGDRLQGQLPAGLREDWPAVVVATVPRGTP